MTRSRWRTYLAVLFLAAAMIALVTLLLRPGLSPYLAVDELVARAEEFRGNEIRLAGYLADSVAVGPDARATFRVAARGVTLPVVLADRVPPGLPVGTEVLLDGRLDEDGTFHAHRLLTQCSSRYSEKLGTPPTGAAPPVELDP